MKRMPIGILALFLIFAWMGPAAAQQVEPPYDPAILPQEYAGPPLPLNVPGSMANSGAARLSYPISVPPGRRGMAPRISLEYNSSGRNGMVGVGWSLPLGAIQRSTRNGLDYKSAAFEHDGEELVPRPDWGAGFYGAKREEAFSKYQLVSASSGWVMTTREGVRYFFGSQAGSRQENQFGVFQWCLDRVEDPNGNYYLITYLKDQGQIYPARMAYTGNGPLRPTHSIDFAYSGRPDAVESYLTKTCIVTAKLLTAVTTQANGQTARSYAMVYETGRSGRSRLKQVEADPLPPVTFTYEDGGNGVYSRRISTATDGENASGFVFNGHCDFDGHPDPIKRFTEIVEGPTIMDPAHAIAELKSERRRQRALEIGNAIAKSAERGELAKIEEYARELVECECPPEKKTDPPFPYPAMAGAAGEFTLAHSDLVESPEAFIFMAFMACLGSVLSKRLTVNSYIRTQPRLNVALIGESAFDRKSTTLNIVTRFFNETIEGGFPVSWGVGSAEGLQLSLQEHQQSPCGLLLAVDELKSLVSKCSIEGSVLLPCINTLFESNQAHNATKKKVIAITDAHLSILAASTLPTYERLFNSTFTDIGFTNRLFIVVGKSTKRYAIPRRLTDVDRRELADYLGRVLKHVGDGLVLDFTPEASTFYEQWYANMEKTEHARRLDTYSMRLAMLLAVNDLKPIIDLETIQHAIALCDWQLEVRKAHDPIDADSKMAQMEERIRRALHQRGPLRERELKRHVSANRAGLWFYTKAADNLRQCGEIEYNAKRKEYRLV